MKPLSPRAQHALRAYRSENTISPALRARLLSRALAGASEVQPAHEPVARETPRVPKISRLRLVTWAGSASVLVLGVGLLLRPSADSASDARTVPPLVVAAPAAHVANDRADRPVSVTPLRAAPAFPTEERARGKRTALERKPKSAPPVARSAPAASDEPMEQPSAVEASVVPARAEESTASAQPSRDSVGTTESVQGAAYGESPRTSVAHVPTRRVDDAPGPAPSLDEEVMLMRRAYDSLRADEAGRALSALAEHARLFPQGKLTTMRLVARIQALCDLGRRDEASQESARFLREHADSPYVSRVQKVCVPRKSGTP